MQNPFVTALERAEKIIARFYNALNTIEHICNSPDVSDTEKIMHILGKIDRTRAEISEI